MGSNLASESEQANALARLARVEQRDPAKAPPFMHVVPPQPAGEHDDAAAESDDAAAEPDDSADPFDVAPSLEQPDKATGGAAVR